MCVHPFMASSPVPHVDFRFHSLAILWASAIRSGVILSPKNSSPLTAAASSCGTPSTATVLKGEVLGDSTS